MCPNSTPYDLKWNLKTQEVLIKIENTIFRPKNQFEHKFLKIGKNLFLKIIINLLNFVKTKDKIIDLVFGFFRSL